MSILDIYESLDADRRLIDLKQLLPRLPRRARRSTWTVADTVWNELPADLMITAAEGPDLFEAARDTQRRLKYREFLKMAEGALQVIWARFAAFDEKAVVPWLVVRCIDGGFWRIETDDQPTLVSVERNFNRVALVEP